MKKCTLRGVALIAFAGFALAVHAQDTIDQSQYPVILQQPVDQCLPAGSAATFSVVASNVDSYQWYANNNALDGQTNSSMTLPSVGIGDVGYYYAAVIKGSEIVPTRSANLNVYVVSGSTSTSTTSSGPKTKSGFASMTMSTADLSGGVVTVFGTPVVSSGGSGTGCPGKYSGYVNYTKPPSQGGGWTPSTGPHTATDTNQINTRVQYVGCYGDSGCGQTTVTVPDPYMSPSYRFTIYFPTNSPVPTNAYPITLSGFNP